MRYLPVMLIIALIALGACGQLNDGGLEDVCHKGPYRSVSQCDPLIKLEFNNLGGGITWLNGTSGEEIRCPVVGPDSMSQECKTLMNNPPTCTKTVQCAQKNPDDGTQIANPASKNCIDKGGKLDIRDTPDGQIGVCAIDGKECEEWALFRGEGCVAPATGSEPSPPSSPKAFCMDDGTNVDDCGAMFKVSLKDNVGTRYVDKKSGAGTICAPDATDQTCKRLATITCGAPYVCLKDSFVACPAEKPEGPVACTMEWMPVCGKIGLNMGDTVFQTYGNKCDACAAMKVVGYTPGECDAALLNRSYKSTDTDVCARMKFACLDGQQYFGDKTGCGCEPAAPAIPPDAVVCNHTLVRGWMCTQNYDPVCGSDGQTYSNSCTACKNEAVDSYVNGSCPQPKEYVTCTDPRKQACTRDYNPVCADKDNGIRCIRAPCPSTDKVTYANGCTACADAKVYGYVPGACVNDTTPPAPSAKLMPPQVVCGSDSERTQATERGLRCVDACPADTYTGQDTLRYCIAHYGKTETLQMAKCTKSTDCPSESQCGFASRGTDGTAMSWSVKTDGFRCLPNPYASYLVLSGLETLDADGKSVTMIA